MNPQGLIGWKTRLRLTGWLLGTLTATNSTVRVWYPSFSHHAVRYGFASNTGWKQTRTPQNTATNPHTQRASGDPPANSSA